MSLARSFIKGPRFAFHHKEKLMACEACVFGSGKHTCGSNLASSPRTHRFFLSRTSHSPACVCGKPEGHAIHIR